MYMKCNYHSDKRQGKGVKGSSHLAYTACLYAKNNTEDPSPLAFQLTVLIFLQDRELQ